MQEETKVTPMMAQYKQLKEEAKEAILLFRMGDFYEAFYEDAKILAECCELTLTKRGGNPMSGVPWHTVENIIDRLIKEGHRVALAEQMELPQKGQGLVKRKIVRFITPGTTTSQTLLSEKENRYIISLTQVGSLYGLAFSDVSTSEFKVIELESIRSLLDELYRLKPAEIITHPKFYEKQTVLFKEIKENLTSCISIRANYLFDHQNSYAILTNHFKVLHLDSMGLKAMVAAINAAGALLSYLKEELSLPTGHIRSLQRYHSGNYLSIDKVTMRHLELVDSLYPEKKSTLFHFLDRCQTSMGTRTLRMWVKHPLLKVEEIRQRQEAIEKLVFMPLNANQLKNHLKKVKDLMRLMMKVSAKWATAVDLVSLRYSLEEVAPIKELICSLHSALWDSLAEDLGDFKELISLLQRALVEEPALRLGEGNTFKVEYDAGLRELIHLSENSKEILAQYQEELKERTGAKSLRVHYNKIFGYYIDVSKKQAELLNSEFLKKQTLVNNERFTTERLQEIERKLLDAEEKRVSVEKELFTALREEVANSFDKIMATAHALSNVDALLSLALLSYENNWQRPHIDNSSILEIKGGCHPIIAAKLGRERFIPNDTHLDCNESQLVLLTGPNMAGKSTYIRQVALIVILAQIGSFVPAASAHIGIVDQIFTRIGASDDLSRGQSTFMVEMAECAHILNHATSQSLVILDEIGRGTSTYDGLALAWSIAEYLLLTKGRAAKTLFATHYFELTQLEKKLKGVVNYHAAVEELDDQITFLYNICKGKADRSYGIHVAKLAHMPPRVITRASEILAELEDKQSKQIWTPKSKNHSTNQMMLFDI